MSNDNRIAKLERAVKRLEESIANIRQEAETLNGPEKAARHENDPAQPQGKSAFKAEVPSSPHDPNKPQKPWYKTLTEWKIRLELVAIPFAILYACVTFMQWRDLRRNFVVNQRPWVHFRYSKKHDPAIQLSADKQLEIPGQFINTGKTPAFHIRASIYVQVVPPGEDPELAGRNQPIPEPGKPFPPGGYSVRSIPLQPVASAVLYPSGYTGFTVFQVIKPPHQMNRPVPLTASQYQDLQQGKSYIVVWGEVWYQDIFGVNHWAKFCKSGRPEWRVADAPYKSCVEYSDVDNNE